MAFSGSGERKFPSICPWSRFIPNSTGSQRFLETSSRRRLGWHCLKNSMGSPMQHGTGSVTLAIVTWAVQGTWLKTLVMDIAICDVFSKFKLLYTPLVCFPISSLLLICALSHQRMVGTMSSVFMVFFSGMLWRTELSCVLDIEHGQLSLGL